MQSYLAVFAEVFLCHVKDGLGAVIKLVEQLPVRGEFVEP